MRRLTRGRAATDDEGTPQGGAASEPVDATHDAQQGGAGVPANGTLPAAGEEPTTAVLPTVAGESAGHGSSAGAGASAGADAVTAGSPEADRDLPAGVDPGRLAAVPSSARRGRLRHRLRYLRGVRELLLRDIGGFYYEAQRAEGGAEAHQRLLDAKAARLTKLDEEMRELESRLDESHPETLLRVPGVGGSCPACGEVHGSDARYCSRCGTALGRRAGAVSATTGPVPTVASGESKQTTASLWGRPKRPEPPGPEDATGATGQQRAETDEARGGAGGDPATSGAAATDGESPARRSSESGRDVADEAHRDVAATDESRSGTAGETGASEPRGGAADDAPAPGETTEAPAGRERS